MGTIVYLRPKNPGDAAAGDLHDWCVELESRLSGSHPTAAVIDHSGPCDRTQAAAGMPAAGNLVFFFGHGRTDELTGTYGAAAVDKANAASAAGKALVAVACLAGRSLGPDAVTAGVTAFLGWNVKLLWLAPPAGQLGRFGSAIVDSLETLGGSVTIGDVKARLSVELDQVAEYYRTGPGSSGPNAQLAYYGAAAAAGQTVVCGNDADVPL